MTLSACSSLATVAMCVHVCMCARVCVVCICVRDVY